ncbi:Mobile element protein [hydrothermal vent metagenome]|uniref:Mobile element protein n=1 Tax=hydrothermal vent metagenome TaxID=652676 RepID=A0A3B0WMS8_9ZZZZ
MISAISNQGKVRFQIYNGTMNAQLLTGFMKRLIKGAKKKVILTCGYTMPNWLNHGWQSMMRA